jgi:FK506-binding protein 1
MKGDIVTVHYDGYLEDGITKFASSRSTMQNSSEENNFYTPSLSFQLGSRQVIEGWDIAIPRMSHGQISRVTIPPMFGCGPYGYEPMIPPNATLIF